MRKVGICRCLLPPLGIILLVASLLAGVGFLIYRLIFLDIFDMICYICVKANNYFNIFRDAIFTVQFFTSFVFLCYRYNGTVTAEWPGNPKSPSGWFFC